MTAIEPGVVIFSKQALEAASIDAEESAPQGLVVEVQTDFDRETGEVRRAFRCINRNRNGLRVHVIPEDEVGQVGVRDPGVIRARFREVLGERVNEAGLRGMRPRGGHLTNADVEAVWTAWQLLRAEGLVPEHDGAAAPVASMPAAACEVEGCDTRGPHQHDSWVAARAKAAS